MQMVRTPPGAALRGPESQPMGVPEKTRGETGSPAAGPRTAGRWAAATLDVCPEVDGQSRAKGIQRGQGKAPQREGDLLLSDAG